MTAWGSKQAWTSEARFPESRPLPASVYLGMCFHLTVPHSWGCQLSEPLRDTVRIHGINPIGSALEKVLTHKSRFTCMRETRYPQTKGSQYHR